MPAVNSEIARSAGLPGRLDFAVGAVHSAPDLPREKQTARLLAATDNANIVVLVHPMGRAIGAPQR